MKTRADLKLEYKERTQAAGIFQINNTVTGKLIMLEGLWIEPLDPFSERKLRHA